jgi:hypothetical protein
MLAQVVQTQRVRIPNQQPQDAMSDRERTNPPDGLRVETDGDEMAQCPVAANDSQRPVLCSHKLAGSTNHTFQHSFKAQLLCDRDDRSQNAAHLLLGQQQILAPGSYGRRKK